MPRQMKEEIVNYGFEIKTIDKEMNNIIYILTKWHTVCADPEQYCSQPCNHDRDSTCAVSG